MNNIEIAHLLRQGASMVRKRLDALFAERLEQDYRDAMAAVLDARER